MEICIITKQNTNFIYNIKIIIVTYFMLQIKKVVIMQSYLVAFLFCNHFRLYLDGRKIVKIDILKSRKMFINK